MHDIPENIMALAGSGWRPWLAHIHGPLEGAVERYENAIQATLGKRLPSGLVVDVGCRSGLSTAALLRSGYEVLGLDPAPDALEWASERLGPSYGERVRFQTVDGFRVPSEHEGQVDGLSVLNGAFSTVLTKEAQVELLSSMFRALRPGGILMLGTEDYRALLATDPDAFVSRPVLCEDRDGQFVFVERRHWNGRPRARLYRREYLRLGLEGTVQKLEGEFLATTEAEIGNLLEEVGFGARVVHGPLETGFPLQILVATKPPVPMVHYLPSGMEKLIDEKEQPHSGEPVKFNFFPEDLDENPFQEAPTQRKNTLTLARDRRGKQALVRRRQATLVMFSGGIDSVYALHRLLRESDDEIIAHHIHFINREGRHRAEDAACRRIVEFLRSSVRNFVYTESTIDRRHFRAFGMDDMSVGFEVGVIANSFLIDRGFGIDRWTSGTCLEEEIEYYGPREIERFEHVLNAVAASCYPNPAPRFFQLEMIPKREQMDYMGPELTGLCWTCRSPVWQADGTPTECGTCKTCNLMNKIRRGEETIPHKPTKLP
ncbi:methyltransferase domain-containing protein [Hwanghaeella grinnelliae]|uniref:Methyltransferase domain-containing protein n=1 Tax=Hwanghaeella grinnelliae TaxID=2500179 RepID=A0A437QMN3_9PROT|nr:methyltransferase domain-containing protein [Hwanghaeella grinnelliae]RVU35757.1 methyltransferase domain-containing protein [Hwanghaeella grinnelliae]